MFLDLLNPGFAFTKTTWPDAIYGLFGLGSGWGALQPSLVLGGLWLPVLYCIRSVSIISNRKNSN